LFFRHIRCFDPVEISLLSVACSVLTLCSLPPWASRGQEKRGEACTLGFIASLQHGGDPQRVLPGQIFVSPSARQTPPKLRINPLAHSFLRFFFPRHNPSFSLEICAFNFFPLAFPIYGGNRRRLRLGTPPPPPNLPHHPRPNRHTGASIVISLRRPTSPPPHSLPVVPARHFTRSFFVLAPLRSKKSPSR